MQAPKNQLFCTKESNQESDVQRQSFSTGGSRDVDQVCHKLKC